MRLRARALAAILVMEISGAAHAANLGGNCCDDLEQRIAALEAATGRKTAGQVNLTGPGLNFAPTSGTDANGNPLFARGTFIAGMNLSKFAYADRGGLALMRGVDNVLADSAFATAIGTNVWVSSLGSYTALGDGALLDAGQRLGGALAGVTFGTGSPFAFGLFGGAARSDLDIGNSENTQTDYGVFGGYARVSSGGLLIDASLTGASSTEQGERTIYTNIGPSPLVKGNREFDGWIISPALGVGWRVPLAEGGVIILAEKVRGQFMDLDGYVETGPSAHATVGARDLDNAETRLELGFIEDVAAGPLAALSVHTKVGLSVLRRFGDKDVVAEMLGVPLTFDAGLAKTETGGYVGAGFDAALTQSVTLFADTELLVTGVSQSVVGSAGINAKF